MFFKYFLYINTSFDLLCIIKHIVQLLVHNLFIKIERYKKKLLEDCNVKPHESEKYFGSIKHQKRQICEEVLICKPKIVIRPFNVNTIYMLFLIFSTTPFASFLWHIHFIIKISKSVDQLKAIENNLQY